MYDLGLLNIIIYLTELSTFVIYIYQFCDAYLLSIIYVTDMCSPV